MKTSEMNRSYSKLQTTIDDDVYRGVRLRNMNIQDNPFKSI